MKAVIHCSDCRVSDTAWVLRGWRWNAAGKAMGVVEHAACGRMVKAGPKRLALIGLPFEPSPGEVVVGWAPDTLSYEERQEAHERSIRRTMEAPPKPR